MEDKCVSCGEIIPEGRQVCPSCEKKSRWAERAEYFKRVQRCVRCGKQDAYTLAGKQRCYECTEKDKKKQAERNKAHREEINQKMHERYVRLKAEGICVVCGKREAQKRRVLCKRCAVKLNEAKKRRYLEKARGEANG